VTFNVTVLVKLAGLAIVSGDGQSAVVGAEFAEPLVVRMEALHGGAAGVPVTFAVAEGPGQLASEAITTDADGLAQIRVTAGSEPGPIRVTAAAEGHSVTFHLAAKWRGLTADSLLNAASLKPGVAFGSLVVVEGEGLTSGLRLPVDTCYGGGGIEGPRPPVMAGIEVEFSGWKAPIFSVCRDGGEVGRITVQAPFELAPGAVTVVVRTGVGTLEARETVIGGVPILPAFPGIFEQGTGAERMAVALRVDGTPVTAAGPARKGDTLRILATGLGPVLPAVKTNQPGVPGQVPFFRPVLKLGGREVEGVTAEYGKNLIGVFVVTFQVPADAAAGPDVPLELSVVEGEAKVYAGPPSRLAIE
jgi:uncharacterized protein (TIGR03437 family)